MNIIEQAKNFYELIGIDMFKDISASMRHGYVLKSHDSLLLANAVDSQAELHPVAE